MTHRTVPILEIAELVRRLIGTKTNLKKATMHIERMGSMLLSDEIEDGVSFRIHVLLANFHGSRLELLGNTTGLVCAPKDNERPFSLAFGEGACGAAFVSKSSVVNNDVVSSGGPYIAWDPNTKASMAVPLFLGLRTNLRRTVVGVLNVESNVCGVFAADLQRKVEAIAELAGAVLEAQDASLRENSRKQAFAEAIEVSHDIRFSKANQFDSLERSISSIVHPALQWMRDSHLEVALFDGPELVIAYSTIEGLAGSRFPLAECAAAELAEGQHKDHLLYNNFSIQAPPRYKNVANLKEGTAAEIMVVIKGAKHRRIGVINAESSSADAFTPWAKNLLFRCSKDLSPLLEMMRVSHDLAAAREQDRIYLLETFSKRTLALAGHHFGNTFGEARNRLFLQIYSKQRKGEWDSLDEELREDLETCLEMLTQGLDHVRDLERVVDDEHLISPVALVDELRLRQYPFPQEIKASSIKVVETEGWKKLRGVEVCCAGLEWVFSNAITNAIRELQDARVDSRVIELDARFEDHAKRIKISIRDNGRGIRPDLLAELFEPASLRKQTLGARNGAGLPWSRSQIRRSGGDLGVETNWNGGGLTDSGTTFWVQLEVKNNVKG